MRKFYLFAIISLVFSIISCKKNNEQNLEKLTNIDLVFKSSFGETPLILNKSYAYDQDIELFFSKFNFYISDIALITTTCTGSQVELSEVAIVDFNSSNADSLSALAGFTLEAKNIPVGDYAGVRLGIGVSPELNRENPSKYSTSHPLGQASEYWEGWKSYIFSKVEGRADTDQDGSYDLGFAYHMGSDDAYREICLFEDISLEEGEVSDLNLMIDLKKLFITDAAVFDIMENPGTHTEEGLQISTTLMDNFEGAFSVE